MREKLQVALDWLRGFLEAMMGAQAYDETAFKQQIRDLVGGFKEDELPPHLDLDACQGDERPASRSDTHPDT